jgi:hypothetical protein
MAKTAHINVRLQGRGRKARPGVIQLRDAVIVAGLCVIAALLVGIAAVYLAVNRVWPVLAPVHGHERLHVWSRFSLLAAQEVRSWQIRPWR